MIMLQIKAVVKPECLSEYTPLATQLTQASQQEEGCIFYHLLQDEKEANVFYIAELWKDEEALKQHQEMEHFVSIAPLLKAMRLETIVWKNSVIL